MEAKKYYPVNEMVKLFGLKPNLDLFLRFILYCLWLWVVNLENLTPLSFRPNPKHCFPLSGPVLSPPPPHTHTHTSTVWLTHTACRLHLPGYPFVSYIIALNFIGGRNRRELPTLANFLTNYHLMLHRVHLAWEGFELATLVVICTDYTGSYKSN